MTIGLVHPGEMGAAVGAALRSGGHTLLWASHGRSAATARRAKEAGLEDAGTLEELGRRSDVILSLCPPHAAVDVARSLTAFAGTYVDANAVSPATARRLATLVGRYVDGGVIGPPPREAGTTRLYLSGAEAEPVAEFFAGTIVDARVISADPTAASALKMAYAAWTKGTAALLLAVRAVARAEGVEQALLDEWSMSLPELADRVRRGGPVGARQGLAVGRRDGRDRRHVRRRGPAGRLSPCGRRRLPPSPARARGRRRRRRARVVGAACGSAPT